MKIFSVAFCPLLSPFVHFCPLPSTSVPFCPLRSGQKWTEGKIARFEMGPEKPLTGVSDASDTQYRWNLTISRCIELADAWNSHCNGTTACEFRVFCGNSHFPSSLHLVQILPRGFNATVDGFLRCSNHALAMLVFGGRSKWIGIWNSWVRKYENGSGQKWTLPSKKLSNIPFAHKIWRTLSS